MEDPKSQRKKRLEYSLRILRNPDPNKLDRLQSRVLGLRDEYIVKLREDIRDGPDGPVSWKDVDIYGYPGTDEELQDLPPMPPLGIKVELEKYFKIYSAGFRAKPARRIELPPGVAICHFFKKLLPSRAVDEFIEPHFADLHNDYFKALAAGDTAEARKVKAYYLLKFAWVLLSALGSALRRVFKVS